jgi:hypothetical protein
MRIFFLFRSNPTNLVVVELKYSGPMISVNNWFFIIVTGKETRMEQYTCIC